MKAHEKRLKIFEEVFQHKDHLDKNIITIAKIAPKSLKKALKPFSGDVDKESILGFYNHKGNIKWKEVLVFTDYKIYCNWKKAKNRKIWYDEITEIKIRPICRNRVVLHLDDGTKVVIRTTIRISHKLLSFINCVKEFNDDVGEYNGEIKANVESHESVAEIAGFEMAKRGMMSRGFDEEKFHARQGHGFAAEQANNLVDRMQGKNAKVLNETIENGPDRTIKHLTGTEFIQTKYCKTAYDSINHCFDESGFRYFYGKGKPMSVEVPANQYHEAIELMEKKIESGCDPRLNGYKAKDIIKKGHVTYEQAVNIAKAGTIKSIAYDAVNGMVVAKSAFGISAIVSLATSIWNGDEFDVALDRAVVTGIEVGGSSFLTSVLAAQLSKAGLNSAMVGGTEAVTNILGSKISAGVVNAFRGGANIYGATAMKSAAKLLRTNIIASIIMTIVLSLSDFNHWIHRRITFKQFFKNFIVLAISIAAGVLGGIGGAVLGTMIFPGAGSAIVSFVCTVVIGAIAGYLVKLLLNIFIKDDAEEMVSIIEEELKNQTEEFLLSKNETEKAVDKITRKLSVQVIRDMVASKDKHEYARDMISPIVERIVQKRKKISIPSQNAIIKAYNSLLSNNETNEAIT